MRTINAFILALVVASVGGAALAAKPRVPSRLESVLTMRVDGELVITPEGKVDEVTLETKMDPAIKDLLEARVRQWTFKPVVVDGQARRARSALRVTLAASRREGEDGYLVRVDNAIFPNAEEDKPKAKNNSGIVADMPTARITVLSMAPPMYPESMMRYGVSGKVLLGLRIGANGKVEAVEPIQSMLFNVRGRDRNLEAAIKAFERAAVGKARAWTFQVAAKDGTPSVRDLTHTVPVVFLMQGDTDEPKEVWRTVVRTPKTELSWLPRREGFNTPGVSDVGSGESMPVASRLQLAQDVVGAVL